jgi:8-oxo-dGTP pyrophosphatase MutT (NUDIX family)
MASEAPNLAKPPAGETADQDAGLLLLPPTQYVPPLTPTNTAQAPDKAATAASARPSELPPVPSPATTDLGPAPEFHFTFPDRLRGWDKSVAVWLQENNKYFSGVAASAVVFEGERVLVLQRAPHDSMPLQWEPPGGGVDPEETILVGCARELWEEAGLVARRVVRVVPPPGSQDGDGVEREDREDRDLGIPFSNRTGDKFYYKFTFEVEVEDAEAVRTDPNEHVGWMWLTEEEVENCRTSNGSAVSFTMSSVRKQLLGAFDLRKAA